MLILGVVLMILAQLSVYAGSQDLVGIASGLSLLALLASLVLFIGAAATRVRWAVGVALVGLVAEIGAALLLLVHEPQPAFEHPEWGWYWPIVNTLYIGGLASAVAALIGSGVGLIAARTTLGAVALVLAVAAIVVNRIAPYR
jgi:hypothetical protein